MALDATRPDRSAEELRAGWPSILACLALALFTWGFGFHGQGVYMAELNATRGWSVSVLSFVLTTHFLAGAAFLTLLHRAFSFLGTRAVLVTAVGCLAAGVMALGQATALWQVVLAELVMALGWAGASSAAISMSLSERFLARRGFAISLALVGASGASFTVAPALLHMCQHYGLYEGVRRLVVPALLLLVPLLLLALRPAPEGHTNIRTLAIPPSRPLLRKWRFWSIALPFALALCAQSGFLTHLVAILQARLGVSATAIALAASGIAAVAGRLGLAPFVDRLAPRIVAVGSFGMQGAALLLIAASTSWQAGLFVGVVLFGMNIGIVATLPALIVGREFGHGEFMGVLGLTTAIGQATYAFGPLLVGLLRDNAGDRVGLAACSSLSLAACVAVMFKASADGVPAAGQTWTERGSAQPPRAGEP